MALITDLEHIESQIEFETAIKDNEQVMVCCGRMGPMCIPVYAVMSELRSSFENVKFVDMEFDCADAHLIRNLPECQGFTGLPFTVYFKNGKPVHATTSIQNREQVRGILEDKFTK